MSRTGCIDILANNAAAFDLTPILDVQESSFDRLFAVNVKGLFFALRAVARAMVQSGRGGTIVNMASQAGRRGEANSAIYAATKAAVISLTQSAALGLVAEGIRVNAIAPGVIETPMWDQIDARYAALEGIAPEEKRRRVSAAVPMKRMGSLHEVAGTAAFHLAWVRKNTARLFPGFE